MIRPLAAILALVALATPPLRAQTADPPGVAGLLEAVEEGRAEDILAFAGDRLEIGLFAATRTYSRSQARFVLESFFRENPPASVTLERSAGTDVGWFASARVAVVRAEQPLRLYIRLRRQGDRWLLREIAFRRAAQ